MSPAPYHDTVVPFYFEKKKQLCWCVEDGTESGRFRPDPSLFPVLLLLGRLRVDSSRPDAPPDGLASGPSAETFPTDLEELVALVGACGASPVLKIRQMAARALIPLAGSGNDSVRILQRVRQVKKQTTTKKTKTK